MKRIFSIRFLAFVLFASMLTGCAAPKDSSPVSSAPSAQSEVTQSSPDTAKPFVYGVEMDPGNNLNVITTDDRVGLSSLKMLYSPLYMYNAGGMEMFLADSVFSSEDHLTQTVKLKDNVQWSDGEKFSADDVVFTFQKILENPKSAANGALRIEDQPIEVRKIDDQTVAFKYPKAVAAAQEMLSGIFILPAHIYKNEADIESSKLNANPIGTGPYTLEEYKTGEYLKFKANPTYFKGAPKIATVIFRVVPDANTAKLALQKGELTAYSVQPSDMADLSANTALKAYPYSEGRVGYLALNTQSPAMKDIKFRQAVLFALDKEQINQAAYLSNEYVSPVYTFLPSNHPQAAYNEVEKYEHDLEKAKLLLQESAISNPSIRLAYYSNSGAQKKVAAVMQQQLKQAGISCEVIGMEPNALMQEVKKANPSFDANLGGYIMGADPSTFEPLFKTGSANNVTHLSDPELDEMFDQAAVEFDEAKRKDLYVQIQKKVQDQAAFYPYADNKRILVMDASVEGVQEAGLVPIFTFEDMSKLYFQ